MAYVNCGVLRVACCAFASLSVSVEAADAATVPQTVGWLAPRAAEEHCALRLSVRALDPCSIPDGWRAMRIDAAAAHCAIVEVASQRPSAVNVRASHVPTAGPLVLLGIATLVGSPRRVQR